MIIYRVICASPERVRTSWTPLEYGLIVSFLMGVAAVWFVHNV